LRPRGASPGSGSAGRAAAAGAVEATAGGLRRASPRLAAGLGALVCVLVVVEVVLTVWSGDLRVSNNGFWLVTILGFAGVGVVVARHEPGNPVGWLLGGVAVTVLLQQVLRLYSVLDYREHGGALPLGGAVLFAVGSWTLLSPLLGLPVILLFPDGRAPTRGWRRALWAYTALAVFFMIGQIAGEASVHAGRPVQVSLLGEYAGNAGQTGLGNVLSTAGWLVVPFFLVCWGAFVGHQVGAWRRSAGERREQLKWLMFGGALCVCCTVIVVVSSSGAGLVEVLAAAATIGIVALPLGIGVGILKYRLYEIDRLISRTLSYSILTVVLGGFYLGLVVLTTRVLPFSSPVGVAVSTLLAAWLFSPLRRRVQRLVDRRFNRPRYDAEASVTAFGRRLRDSVELDTVRAELLRVVEGAFEPVHASVWLRQAGEGQPR